MLLARGRQKEEVVPYLIEMLEKRRDLKSARWDLPAGLIEDLLLQLIRVLHCESRLLATREEVMVIAIVAIR
jgi:hypothetical protein